MTRRAHLGIDAGTQSTKAILLDADSAEPLGLGRAAHPPVAGSGGAREQDPAVWLEATTAAIRAALAEASAALGGEPLDVAGVAVSAQQHGLVCLDGHDRPVRPAKLWNDTTTGEDAAALTERLGGREAVLARTGNEFLPGYTAPAVAWLRRREPEAYAATVRICLPHDYLNLWLTGDFATEPGDASGTAYFDAVGRAYAPAVLAAIDPARDWEATLPPIVPSRSIIGWLRSAAAESLGLTPGIPVTAGGGDNMCAALGAGLVGPGPLAVSLGTSGTVFADSAEPRVDPLGEAATFCDSAGGWLPLACVLNCTGPLTWIRSVLDLDVAAADALLGDSPPGARGLTFLPWLDGERTPLRPPASAAFLGLTGEHARGDLVRAVYEGVTIGLHYGFEALRRTGVEADEVLLVGGGAASDAWAQLVADAFGLPVARPDVPEAAARGAALQARWVIDGIVPGRPPIAASWEPARSPALADAIARAAVARSRPLPPRSGVPVPGAAPAIGTVVADPVGVQAAGR